MTCHNKRRSSETKLEFGDNLITDIYRVMGKCKEAEQYFESYFVDPACDINDAIRSITFPYLRRCTLLWKLINCSKIMPFSDGVQSWGGSSYEANSLEYATNNAEELPEVEKLEKMFNIPPLDLIINEKESRLTALRWLSHFLEVFEAQKIQHPLRCTPAVPFKLMLLPHLYQDLLQRWLVTSCSILLPFCCSYSSITWCMCPTSGILKSLALTAELWRRSLHCACYVVNCAHQTGRHAAGYNYLMLYLHSCMYLLIKPVFFLGGGGRAGFTA